MATYHLVRDGEIVDTREFEGAAPLLAANKGLWLPEEFDEVAFDPDTQVQLAETLSVEPGRVVRSRPVRAKTSDEVAAMKAAKKVEISTQFQARAYAPITHTVDGDAYLFDADKDAIENLTGVMAMITAGVLTTARPWKPYGAAPINMEPADFVALVAVIAARKDALYGVKWTREAQLAALSAAGDVAAFDPAEGWS